MSKLAILIIIGFGVGIISYLFTNMRAQNLPTIHDDIFLERFKGVFPGLPDKMILQERKYIAKQLNIYYEKLDVNTTFEELAQKLNFLGSYNLAIGDLEQDLSEFFERQQIKKPYANPSTIGELIYEIVKAKLNTVK